MKTYIINLKTSHERKNYMIKLLEPYKSFLDVNFIEAFNGKVLSKEELSHIWNQSETFKTYGRFMKSGEIGCALSHRICYEEICKNNDKMALILEDDISIQNVDVKSLILSVEKVLLTEVPTVVLLSGDYWFTKKLNVINNNFQLVNVREAMGAISYIVNKNAAEKLKKIKKNFLADDWYNLKKSGIKLYALYPHFVDAADLGTEISADGYVGTIRDNLPILRKMSSYYRAIIRRILGELGHFEKRVCF